MDLSFIESRLKKGNYYSGVGTALLKEAVKESIARGHDGKIRVLAAYHPQPFPFYYKNNFMPTSQYKKYAPIIDFAARTNKTIEQLAPSPISGIQMKLDELGAIALLKDEHLYKNTQFKELESTVINSSKYQAFAAQSPDDTEYYLTITDSSNKDKIAYSSRLIPVLRDDSLIGFAYQDELYHKTLPEEVLDFAHKQSGILVKKLNED